MADLSNIKEKTKEMAGSALRMWQLAYDAFIGHDVDLITAALEEENKINAAQENINSMIVSLSGSHLAEQDRELVAIYANIAADFELIGDYCKDILERVQIKIEEKLLFSEEAVAEYTELYNKAKSSLEEVVFALEKDNPGMVKEVLKREEHIDSLVDKYRNEHNQRLVDGKCTPMACNMYLNMLDFTAAVYYHIKKIAKNLLKIKT